MSFSFHRPFDVKVDVFVLQLPYVVREPRSGLMAVAEVALVPGYPVPDGAVGNAGVRFLRAGGELGHLCTIDNALGHAVAGNGTLSPSSVAIAPTALLHLVATEHLVVVLLDGLGHVRHSGVADLHRVPVDHPPYLVVWSWFVAGGLESTSCKNLAPMLVEIDWENGGLNHVTLLDLVRRLALAVVAEVGSSQTSLWS